MNWRYIVGKSLSRFGNTILASPWMPPVKGIPYGISYPYDIKRFLRGQRTIQTIFDVGANIGQTSLFLRQHFQQAEIFAFEPINATYKILETNTKAYPQIHAFPYALGSQVGKKQVHLEENSELNSLVDRKPPATTRSQVKEEVTIETIDNFCRDRKIQGIDLLKIDVEGYELEVLRGAEETLSQHRIGLVYAEVTLNSTSSRHQNFFQLNDYLKSKGFMFSGLYEVFRWGDAKQYFGFCNALFINSSWQENS